MNDSATDELERGKEPRMRKRWLFPGPMELAYLSVFAAAGLAVKQLAYPLAAMVTSGSALPVAPLAAGAYMMWLVAGRAITGYRLAGTFIGLVQAIVAFLLVFGRHGPFNIPLYVATGLTVDALFFVLGPIARTMPGCVVENAAASLVGTVMVVGIELQMARLVVIASALVALGSGAIGGLLAHRLVRFYDSTLGRRFILRERDEKEGKGHVR